MGNIVYFITSLSVGGAQKALLNLTSSTFSLKHPPIVVALVDGQGMRQQFVDAGIPVQVLDINRLSGLLLLLPRLVRLLWQSKPRIIHGWQHHGNVLATLAWLLGGRKSSLWWGVHHTPEQATLERAQHAWLLLIGRWLSRFPQRIIYVSQRSRDRHAELGYAMQAAQVIANGIPQGVAGDQASLRAAVYQELGIAPEACVVGSLTRYVPEKDIPNLFAAIAHFQQQFTQDVHFVLAGEGMVAEREVLQNLLATLPRSEQVHLLGVRSDASRLLAAMSIATLSSQREAFPLFLAEAMAAGVPCVATDVGDIAEFIADTGRVVAVQDPQALALAWQDVLALDNKHYQHLAAQAQQRVQQHYSLDAVIQAYETGLAEA